MIGPAYDFDQDEVKMPSWSAATSQVRAPLVTCLPCTTCFYRCSVLR